MLRARTAATSGWFRGTPGLRTAKSNGRSGKPVAPSSMVAPFAKSFSACSASASPFAVSRANTRAPRDSNSSVASTPLRPRPTTNTLLSSSANMLSNFQTPKSNHRTEHAQNVEPRHHLRLIPAFFFEVMVQRRHQKNSAPDPVLAPRIFEIGRLNQHRARFRHEHAAGDDQEERLMNEDRDDPERAAERKRPGVAHEDFCGMTIEPKKPQARANHGRAKHREFPCPINVGNLEVLRHDDIAREIRDDQENDGDNDRATNGESIQPVREVHGI